MNQNILSAVAMNETSSSFRLAPTYQSVWATLTRQERVEIRQLLSISATHALRFHRGDGADPALADRADRAEAAAHALWRGHGFADLPTYRMVELVG